MTSETPLIDLTYLTDSSDSSSDISVIDLTKDSENEFVLSIDIGLVNMALCWFNTSLRKIMSVELIQVANTDSSNPVIAEKVGKLAKGWLDKGKGRWRVSCVVIEKQIQHITQKRFGFSKACTHNIVMEASLIAAFTSHQIKTLVVNPSTVATKFSLPKTRYSKKAKTVSLIRTFLTNSEIPGPMNAAVQLISFTPLSLL